MIVTESQARRPVGTVMALYWIVLVVTYSRRCLCYMFPVDDLSHIARCNSSSLM